MGILRHVHNNSHLVNITMGLVIDIILWEFSDIILFYLTVRLSQLAINWPISLAIPRTAPPTVALLVDRS